MSGERKATVTRVSEIPMKPPPRCKTCSEPMRYHGGTYGWHCADHGYERPPRRRRGIGADDLGLIDR